MAIYATISDASPGGPQSQKDEDQAKLISKTAAPAPQSQKNEDHAKLIATVDAVLLLPGLALEARAAVPSRGGAARVAPPQAQVREGRDDAVRGRLRHRGRRRRLRLNID